MKAKRKERLSIICLFVTALIWGFAFVAQSEGNVMGPFTFNSIRNFLGFLSLIPFIWIYYGDLKADRQTITGGICCGICLFLASNTQQFSLLYTTPGKTGFITACYMMLVPIAGLFMGRRISRKVAAAYWPQPLAFIFSAYRRERAFRTSTEVTFWPWYALYSIPSIYSA